ncbi:hypothetical protein [Streptomyces pseudovenezuelae]|uniref:Uncharacterized protein n=1 Tax=Streptomyces pseudovenezuelae TaxID=67350 RepID=A0ABT6LPH0_9ACTN|nr:hypothetical protein [Streptomyces pseudovenezuelae]MDH6217729.1 hypothetical protein [Streptomyces pseudovenezuelae]
MELTGHSTDYIVDGSFPQAMSRFVRRAHQRWPGLFVYGEPVHPAAAADWQLPEADADDYASIVTFSSGSDMEEFWEENGYALDASNQGPYAVFYRLHAEPLQATKVSGVRVGSPEAADTVEGTALLMSQYYAVSLVTPADPSVDQFSKAVVDDFAESFRETPLAGE